MAPSLVNRWCQGVTTNASTLVVILPDPAACRFAAATTPGRSRTVTSCHPAELVAAATVPQPVKARPAAAPERSVRQKMATGLPRSAAATEPGVGLAASGNSGYGLVKQRGLMNQGGTADAELAADIATMGFHCAYRNIQPFRDGSIAVTQTEQA